ncbi:MAG: Gfo/Idh/MocA family oxidoreductase [Oscillospiraceae bacterium]|nr:Gfo/Idh/MocA family oxidoreductase [Oscillospiraceae bacterium]
MKNGKLQVGIIGCGNIANTKHLPNLAKFPERVEAVAFCDLIAEKAEKTKAKFGTPDALVCTDYHDLIRLDLDAVYVCTPNRSHAELTVAALETGHNVMCEKPMAINSAEAKRMLEARDKSGKLLTIGYQNRYRKDTMTLKKLAQSGSLGEIYWAKAHALRRRGIPTWGVFTNKFEQGGGPLIDIGTHSLDITLWIMDNYKPVSVLGSTFDKLGRTLHGDEQGTEGHWDEKTYEVEDAAVGLVKFENGATVFLESSWILNTTCQKQAMATFYGTKAGVEMDYASPDGGEGTNRKLVINHISAGCPAVEQIYLEEPENASSDLIFNYPGATAECKTWLDAISGKGQLVVYPEQACVVTQILEAIYQSAATGKLVEL